MDEKTDKIQTPWSYSRITCFDNCKYEYYLNYVLKNDELYFPESNYYAELGSFVHELLAMVFRGEIKAEDAAQYYIDNYDNAVCYRTSSKIMRRNFIVLADYFLELDLDRFKNYEIISVELREEFNVDKYPFIGFIDLLLRDKRDGKMVILDHKSSDYPFKIDGTVKKSSQESFEKYKKQMYLYCHAVYEKYGEFPKEMIWNHFKFSGKLATIPFIKEEYERIINWFKETIEKIEREQDFEPTESYFYCSNLCNFRNSCEYHTLTKKGVPYGEI